MEDDNRNRENNIIPLYPYDGNASNLIDKFYIFGYEPSTLKKNLIDQNLKIYNENHQIETLIPFQLDEEPSILNEITNDINKKIVDTKKVRNLIFPNKVNFYFRIDKIKKLDKRQSAEIKPENIGFNLIDTSDDRSECPMSHRVAFSFYPLEGENSRKCQNGIGYTFYRKLIKKKIIKNKIYTFFVPTTFCILSEFPFYKNFDDMFKRIRKIYSQDLIYIPIEILLYKIVKLTPSPVNTDVIIDFEKMCKQDEVFREYNGEKKKIRYSISPKNNKLINKNIILPKNSIVDEKKFDYKIKFKSLTGYPLINYNLAKVLFHSLSISKIIKIYLIIFFEGDILFFSKNIELLSLTLNCYQNLNYPFNDTLYFNNLVAISLKELKNINNIFSFNKPYPSMIAINNEFVKNYSSGLELPEHMVVDLDNGNIETKYIDDRYSKIFDIIDDIFTNKNYNKNIKQTILYQSIYNIKERLQIAYDQDFIYLNNKFIDVTDKPDKYNIEQLNKYIQESFYEFVIHLTLYCYDNITILEEGDEKNINENEDNNKLIYAKFIINKYKYKNEEELFILEKWEASMKLVNSFQTYVIEHNPLNLFKIPLNFFDEFTSMISRNRTNKFSKEMKYFKIIDHFYLEKKFNKINLIDFKSDMDDYFDNYKEYIMRELEEKGEKNKSSIIKIFNIQEERVLKYQTYGLDNQILLKYINKELNSPPIERISNKNAEINISEIESKIENYCINKNLITSKDICCSNIIMIFSLVLKYLPENIDCSKFLVVLFQEFNIFRKYFSFLLNMIYKVYNHSLEEKNEIKANQMKICFYSCLNCVRNKKIIVNENLEILINKFMRKLREKEKIEEIEEKEEQSEINEIQNNFINDVNLQICYNFSFMQFYSEKFILEAINGMKDSDNDLYVKRGDIKEKISPKIKFIKNKNENIESNFISQKKILNILLNEYKNHFININNNKLDINNILNSCLNIFVFIRNNNEFEEYNEIWKMLENIYLYFINFK